MRELSSRRCGDGWGGGLAGVGYKHGTCVGSFYIWQTLGSRYRQVE